MTTALPADDWKKINDCMLRLYRELDWDRHNRVMLEVLRELVPCDSLGLSLYRPQESFKLIALPENLTTDEITQEALSYVHQSPFGAYYLATQDASWKMESDFMPVEDFQNTEWYHRYLKPAGVNYQIAGILAVIEGTAHLLTIHRTHYGFTERERTILNTVHPHLVTSHVNALACSKARNSLAQIKAAVATAPGAYGYFDADGKVAWMQGKAEAWLLEFFSDEVKAEGNVPQSIARLLRESASEGCAPKQLEKARANECLTVCLGASALGGWILRLERKPKTPPPRFRPLDQLSAAENRVLQWMVEGKRNAEIAAILDLSSRTVEKHVAQILAKLNVENRATAIVRAMELCAAIPPATSASHSWNA